MTRKAILLLPLIIGVWFVVVPIPLVHADYYNYPCNYPFVGTSGSVDFLVHGGGQYCDGPMEINGSHYHCESGGAGIGGGAIGLAPLGGLNVGGFGGSGVGGSAGRCEFRCPDNTHALPPNPPAQWTKHLILDDRHNDCRDHMDPAGMDSAPQEPGSGPPGPGQPDVPAGGELPTTTPTPAAAPPGLADEGSALTPGSPIPGP